MALSGVETPVQRLLTRGPECLTDREILAILLDQGGDTEVELASAVLSDSRSLASLSLVAEPQARYADLGEGRAAVLLAAVEFGRRLAKARLPKRDLLSHPEAVAAYLHLRYGREDQEVAGALYLDVRNRLISDSEIFRGTLCRASVEPRQILKQGLLKGAARFIFFHTHPSGDPTPSAEDWAFTRRMTEAGDVLGIGLLDHLIIGHGGRWTSLRRRLSWWQDGKALSAAKEPAPRRKVKAKYRHPKTGETWAGRGHMARWLRREIEAGAKKEDFLVDSDSQDH